MTAFRKSAIRRLRPREAPALVEHLLRLDDEDRLKRFGRPIADQQVGRYVAGIDWTRAGAIGFFDRGMVRASAQIAWPLLDWLDGAEIGLTVEAPWRNRGIGGELMRRAVTLARNLELGEVRIFTRADNEPVKHLARRAGFTLSRTGTEIEGRLVLPPPDVRSLIEEAADNGAALVDRYFDPPRPGDLLRPADRGDSRTVGG